MNEYGQIVQVKDDKAVIKINRSSACASCGACGIGSHKGEMLLTIPNTLNGEVGDYAELELSSTQVLKASVIVYLIPLIALFVGIAGGFMLAPAFGMDPELLGAVSGIGLTVIAFLGIRAVEPRFKKNHSFSPKMVNIIKTKKKGEDLSGK